MKKLSKLLMAMFFMALAFPKGFAQEIVIELNPGWTWIGYPNAVAMDVATALGDFTPMPGDIINSQYSSTSYNGQRWRGGLTHFMPGWGYMYYSNREEPVSFVFAGSTTPQSQVQVTTSEPMLITAISAMGGGEVTTTDGTYIIVKGLCWATHENPTTNDDFYEEAESGVGTFSVSMTELNIATTYYVRAYAVTPNGTVYGDQKSFITRDGIPEVSTDSITNIMVHRAMCYGTVTDNGGLNVIARGVCWSTSPNPTIADSHTTDGNVTGSFSSSITFLNESTTYYVRAYATTVAGTAYGEEVSFITPSGILEVVTSEVTDVFGDGATFGGSVIDNGVGYGLERGICWSTSPNPTVNDCHAIEWNLEDYISHGITPPNIFGDFTIYITGFNYSTTYYVRAYATTEYGIGYGEEISFTTPEPLWPNGILPGTFSVSENQQVHFSQGNLQYKASTNTWRFGINQWAYVGGCHISEAHGGDGYYEVFSHYGNVFSENGLKCDNTAVSSDYSGWIDLLGWGTSGNDHGAVCYQPWSTSENSTDYKAYGQTTYNLYDQTGQADWGSNAISNGGNQPNQWHTLTMEEWKYIFNTRPTVSGIRYAKAVVFGVSGVILLPDDWDASYFLLNATNASDASFNSNIITASQWSVLEQYGAVFLPQAGLRHRYTYLFFDGGGDEGYDIEMYGFDLGMFYWSSSCKNSTNAWHLSASDSRVNPQNNSRRYNGFAVRLVQDVE